MYEGARQQSHEAMAHTRMSCSVTNCSLLGPSIPHARLSRKGWIVGNEGASCERRLAIEENVVDEQAKEWNGLRMSLLRLDAEALLAAGACAAFMQRDRAGS